MREAWFHPGDNFGQEFAYHKTKSIEIARVAKAEVPAAVVETEADLETAPVVIVNEKGEEKPVEVIVARNEPPAEPVFVAQETVAAQETPAPVEPPATASEHPLFGLLGLGAILASLFMSSLAKRA